MGDVEINSLDGNKIDLKSINIEHGKLAGRGGAFLVEGLKTLAHSNFPLQNCLSLLLLPNNINLLAKKVEL